MKNIITNKEVREGEKNGEMKSLTNGTYKIIEIRKGHVYQAKKLNKANRYVTFSRFNAKSLEDAMQYILAKEV